MTNALINAEAFHLIKQTEMMALEVVGSNPIGRPHHSAKHPEGRTDPAFGMLVSHLTRRSVRKRIWTTRRRRVYSST